jgi:hypothetical protein
MEMFQFGTSIANRGKQSIHAMARGVSDGLCQMVALPLTIWQVNV